MARARKGWLAAAVAVALFASVNGMAHGGDGPTQITGTGVIKCWISTIPQKLPCDLDNEGRRHYLDVAHQHRVTMTIEWEPVNEGAKVLSLELDGNSDCETPDPETWDCAENLVVGPSPLAATLEGMAASNDTLFSAVSVPWVCDGDDIFAPVDYLLSCDEPYVRVVINQTYTYTWTLE